MAAKMQPMPANRAITSTAKAQTATMARRKALAGQANATVTKAARPARVIAAKHSTPVSHYSKTIQPISKQASSMSPKMQKRTTQTQPLSKQAMTAKQAKDQAVQSALRAVATMEEPVATKMKSRKSSRNFVLAFACSALTVTLLGVFIYLNMPNISVRVAAMQAGIEATYPSFIPRGYQLADVSSEKDGHITMNFVGPNSNSFTITEEKSTWDSVSLLTNYVRKAYSSDYSTLREQGITIYADNENAAWVNGGILYKLSATGHNLSKEQLRNLVVSLQ